MNAKTSVFVICVEAIMYLLLYNLYDCAFEKRKGNCDKVYAKIQCKDITKKIFRIEIFQLILSKCMVYFRDLKQALTYSVT